MGSLTNGELCGNLSAASLAGAPVPQTLQSGGSQPCDEGYTTSNHMLDVLVNGCTTFYGFVTIIWVALAPYLVMEKSKRDAAR